MTIRYSVGVERPEEHRAQFTVRIEGGNGGPVDLVFPSWVPGSYVIRPIARNVRGLRAQAPEGGPALPVERIDRGRWRIAAGPAASIRVDYTVYGHELITEALDVTPEHLFLNAALCLPYVDGRKEEPCLVELHVPDHWKVITELAEVERDPPTVRARNYDELVDSPIDCGQPVVLPITPRGVRHRIVLCGNGGNYEAHRLEADLAKIGEATGRIFGTLPFERYTYFFHLGDRRDGGLEHRTSTSIVVPRTVFRPESDYQGFLRLCSHEYFHLFNVKRIRPAVLGPFDYTKENYTRLLWAMEGTTDYYGPLVLRRAGLTCPTKYLEGLAKDIRRYLEIPGRLVSSLEESSFASWVDLYQSYEETVNQSISYYLKGGLVSWCLDLEIRHRTENRSSLDEVWRALWQEFGARERGFGEGELLPIANRVSGLDLADFFARYVSGTQEIDFAGFARHAGLALAPGDKKPEPGDDPPAGYLGIDLENAGGLTRVKSVRDGSPGRRAGLSPGDEIVAVDGSRVNFEQFPAALKRYPAGSTAELALFRRGYLIRKSVTTGEPLPEKYRLSPVESPTGLERQIYEAWLESPWTPPSASAGSPAGR